MIQNGSIGESLIGKETDVNNEGTGCRRERRETGLRKTSILLTFMCIRGAKAVFCPGVMERL